MSTNGHGSERWAQRLARASLVALVTALLIGSGASPFVDGYEAAARKRARGAATSAALKIESFSNAAPIAIPAKTQTAPSTITVSGFETNIADVEVTLSALTHPTTASLDILLVGPGGERVLLMSEAGDEAVGDSPTFDDQAAAQVPNTDSLVSGTFQPTNYDSPVLPDTFAPPAPTNAAHGSALAVFNGTNPNGNWRLFIRNQSTLEAGSLGNGWSLRITAANGVPNAAPDRFQAQAGKALTVAGPGVLGNDRDPDDDVLTAILAGQPARGTVTLQPDGGFTYKAKKKAKGTDSFTYLAEDDTGLRDLETVTIQLKKARNKKKGKR
ncbi:MAG: Ig-like domain-containing protein [Chloroflexota bacterium]|nr:Ig-like domain-containing protein [Chloroflexota bacterium]